MPRPYERYGSGPALIFAHGIGGNQLSWWQQVPHFRDRYSCIIFDAPGFGRSEHPDGTWSFVDSLAGLIDELDLQDVRLVAQSMGGWACLGYAVRRPERVRTLVMADTPGSLALPEIQAWTGSAGEARAELEARDIHPACGARMAREQPALHFLYQQIGALNPTAWSPARRPGGMTRVPPVQPAELQRLQARTLFVIGEEDIVMPPTLLEAATPRARVARVPEAGHSVYFERPDRFNTILDSFLSDS